MIKLIRIVFTSMLCGIIVSSCVKKMSNEDVQENLKAAMSLYLNHQPRIDTSRVKFNVLEVIYFEDKTKYLCNFKVNMKEKRINQLFDTTGNMSARISKDFKNVSRTD
ncbi:MAG TPA: hypothetical protein VGZ90_08640 [Puia sp.]|nr:hypothetical protein [Puia sp.]